MFVVFNYWYSEKSKRTKKNVLAFCFLTELSLLAISIKAEMSKVIEIPPDWKTKILLPFYISLHGFKTNISRELRFLTRGEQYCVAGIGKDWDSQFYS